MKNTISICLLIVTLFFSQAYAQQLTASETIAGIGATLQKVTDGRVEVVGLIPNAPAERAGLAIGDALIQVQSLPGSAAVDIRSLPLADIVAMIRGPAGIPVVVSYIRENSELTVLSILREEFEVSDEE